MNGCSLLSSRFYLPALRVLRKLFENEKSITVTTVFIMVAILLFSLREKNQEERTGQVKIKKSSQGKQPTSQRRPLLKKEITDTSVFSKDIQVVFGVNGESYQTRLKMVNSLPTDLSLEDREALYQFLCNDENGSTDLHLKDRVMEKLEKQNLRPPEYEQTLIDIMQDRSIDGDLRGYAVQHLRTAYEVPEVDKELVKEGLYLSLEDTQSDVAGTAILGLVNLSKKDPDGFDTELITRSALALATDSSTSTTSRLTAIECCAQLGLQDVLPTARSIVSSSGEPVAHKLPAIRAIGLVGGQEDLEILQKLPKNKYLQKAIDAAINAINSK